MSKARLRGLVALLIVLAVLFGASCLSFDPPLFDEAKWREQVESADVSLFHAPHFEDGRFFNPWMPFKQGGFSRLMRWKLESKEQYTEEEENFRPGFIPDLRRRIDSTEGDFIVWIGHATFLMRVNGEFWLTDPMLSDRALLPKRKTPPAMSAEEVAGLPGRLNIIVSHNHYDHLDADTIRALPADSRVFVPLGLKEYMKELGKENIVEMDWWQSVDAGNGMRIVCLPAQHWSRRIGQPVNSTLWASFLLASETVSVYFAGDSGYFRGYKEIGRRYPNIDYALIPITAYRPRWFMHYAHVDVKEALDAFEDLGARYFIPTQWGTFHLGNEPVGYAALELKRTIGERGLDPSRFPVPDLGEIVSLKGRTERIKQSESIPGRQSRPGN